MVSIYLSIKQKPKSISKKIFDHMIKVLGKNPEHIAVAHGAAEDAANTLIKMIEEKYEKD